MNTVWALVADESRARVFARVKTDLPLQDIDDIVPGNGNGRTGNGSPADKSPDAFARKLASYLTEARKSGQFDSLYLIAPDEFRARLQNQMDASTRKKIKKSIGENLATKKVAVIRDVLANLVR